MKRLGVLRGGSWNNNDNNCRVANRNNNNPNNRNNNNGFRLAREKPWPEFFVLRNREACKVNLSLNPEQATAEHSQKGAAAGSLERRPLVPAVPFLHPPEGGL